MSQGALSHHPPVIHPPHARVCTRPVHSLARSLAHSPRSRSQSPEGFGLFAAGFTFLSVLLGGSLLFRAVQLWAWLSAPSAANDANDHHLQHAGIDNSNNHNRNGATSSAMGTACGPLCCFNATWAVLALLSLPAILVMAYNVDNGPEGTLHLIGAGVGMGLICMSGILHALMCLCALCCCRGGSGGDAAGAAGAARCGSSAFDPSLSPAAKAAVYTLQLLLLSGGLASFATWFVSDKSSATLEWIGFLLVLAAYATYCVFYVAGSRAARRHGSDEDGDEKAVPMLI
jgi:hypothetical protein